ncbi:MAG: tRNA guanosine(34) transglycosylase Tgt, partial [Desulfohalobiaceae bacterium]|nr:tRNA guanosine(34) transglycosylase Tgt [Desulfohalobiaceae bacterium]
LRHLYVAREILSYRLNTIHNLTYYMKLITGARQAIEERRFSAYRASLAAAQE